MQKIEKRQLIRKKTFLNNRKFAKQIKIEKKLQNWLIYLLKLENLKNKYLKMKKIEWIFFSKNLEICLKKKGENW